MKAPLWKRFISVFISGSAGLTLPADFSPELSQKQDGMRANLQIPLPMMLFQMYAKSYLWHLFL